MTSHPIPPHDGIAVSLVDGDPALRRARQIMLLSEAYDVRSYATGAALLADPRSRAVACIVVDIGGSGMDTLHAMRRSGWRGGAILLGTAPAPALVHAAERNGDRLLDRAAGDAPLLTAIAASIAVRRPGG